MKNVIRSEIKGCGFEILEENDTKCRFFQDGLYCYYNVKSSTATIHCLKYKLCDTDVLPIVEKYAYRLVKGNSEYVLICSITGIDQVTAKNIFDQLMKIYCQNKYFTLYKQIDQKKLETKKTQIGKKIDSETKKQNVLNKKINDLDKKIEKLKIKKESLELKLKISTNKTMESKSCLSEIDHELSIKNVIEQTKLPEIGYNFECSEKGRFHLSDEVIDLECFYSGTKKEALILSSILTIESLPTKLSKFTFDFYLGDQMSFLVIEDIEEISARIVFLELIEVIGKLKK